MDFKNQDIIDFGTVSFGSTIEKFYEIKNTSTISKTYSVEKYSDNIRYLNSGFNVCPNSSPSIKPGKTFKINVSLTPKAVNIKCSDYVIIKSTTGDETIVFLKAISDSGAKCSLSTSKLKIICPSNEKKFCKTFDIENSGNSTVNFSFIIDANNQQILLNPTQGQISPLKSVTVIATYTPHCSDPFFKKVFCLVECHEPLILDIHAIRLKSSNNNFSFPIIKENPFVFKNSYQCFMNNMMSQMAVSYVSLITVSDCNIDFGQCSSKKEKTVEFSLTNNSKEPVLIKWLKNERVPFKIYPKQLELDGNSCAMFSATFKPLLRDKLFGSYLEAQLFSNDYVWPFTVDINLKGHSFDELSCGWAAQYKVVPLQVLLPPCMPEPLNPSHSTLTIYRLGHLPLAFKFHPPQNTNFIVKPQQGLIREHFEIILVQFYPKEVNDAIYDEKWMISFNSNEVANHCFVNFQASVETPQIIINHGKEIIFPKVHPRSPIEMLIDFHNPTRFPFWYSETVLKGDTVLMTGAGGEMWPYEHKQVAWSFCPQGVGEMEALVCCAPIMKANTKFKSTTVVARGTCEKTELQVIPHGLIYQDVLRGCEQERGFEMTNVGEAFISGALVWLPCENCSIDDVEVNFTPANFAIFPGSSLLISVNLTSLTCGSRTILIGFSINDGSGTPLLPAYISCNFPCLQVSDIRIQNSGPLFTKLDFWKTLQIGKLNNSLLNLKIGESKKVTMYLPSYVKTSDVVIVELLLENRSGIGMFLSLNREKSCNCKPVLTPVSFSRSEWQTICPHKSQVQITPLKAHVSSNEYTILELQVSYNTVGYVENIFKLLIVPEDYESIECTLILCIGRTSIPEGAPYIDNTETRKKDHFIFQMKSVFIGDCFPFVQGFNLYNNTKQSVLYEVNDKSLLDSPFKYVGKRNTISPLSNHLLLFTFLPNQCGIFEAEVDFVIDNYPTKLILRGQGISEAENIENGKPLLPEIEILNIIDPKLFYLSASHIKIGPILPTCSQRHVLYLNNNTNDLISFKWHTTKIQEVGELRVHPCKGAVQPKDLVECRLFVYSKGRPCHLTATITCVFASFTKYATMAKTMQKYRRDAATATDYFIITEAGTENVDLAPPQEDWPRKSYITLSVELDVKLNGTHNNSCLPFAPSVIQPSHFHDSSLDVSNENNLFVGQIVEMILLEALNDLVEKAVPTKKQEFSEKYPQLRAFSDQNDVPVPRHVMQFTVEELLHSVWQEILRMQPRNSTERLRRTLIDQLQQGSDSLEAMSEDSLMKLPYVQAVQCASFESHSSRS